MNSQAKHRFCLRFVLFATSALFLVLATISSALAWTPTETNPVKYMQQVLHHFNITTIEDYKSTSEVEGRTYIGRDLTGITSQNFGIHLNQFLPTPIATTEDTLVVTRNIVGGDPLSLQYGSLYLGGTRNNRIINYNGGGTQYGNPEPAVATLQSKLEAASASLSTVTANNTVILPGQQDAPVRFRITALNSCGFAVFNVAGSDVFGNPHGQNIQLDLNGFNPSGILINVSGTNVTWSKGDMLQQFDNSTWRKRTLWNFFEMTAFDTVGHRMHGAVLAPFATVQTTAVFEGSVAVKSMNSSSEFHVYGYEADPSCLVPPTADNDVSFGGRMLKKGARLKWHTVNERQVVGFNLLRSGKRNGEYVQLNADLIPAKAPGSLNGAAYKFPDRTAKPNKKYFYKLQIVTLNGETLEGPLKVKAR